MRINLIIATYAGIQQKYLNNKYKKNYLKYNLNLLNHINTNIEQITIMKPQINNEHLEIKDYYNFSNIDIGSIKHKIKIYDCENIGISYGQYFEAVSKTLDFDYHIFIEDDYIVFKDYFENDLIEEYNKNENDTLLCSFIYKSRPLHMISYANACGETQENINILTNKLYNIMQLIIFASFQI